MLKLILITVLSFHSFSSMAQGVAEVLIPQVATIQKKIGAGTSQDMAYKAYKSGVRGDSFTVQAIARLFDKEAKVFKDLKKLVKGLEDHLGMVDKWDSLQNLSTITEAQKEIYKKNYETSLEELGQYIVETQLLSTLNRYSDQIKSLNISEKNTKEIVLAGIKDEIQDVLKKKYDFTYGETGLHELRRNIRWPLMELDAFKSFFTTTKTSCSDSKIFQIGSKSPFIHVTENPQAVFTVNYCAYIELIGAVDYIGQVKDDLEKKGVLDQKVSREIFQFSEKMRSDVTRNVLPFLL